MDKHLPVIILRCHKAKKRKKKKKKREFDINIYRKEVRTSIPRLHWIVLSKIDTKDVRVLTFFLLLFFFLFFFFFRICCCCWSLLYSAMLRSPTDSLRLNVILHEWLAFYSAFLSTHRSGVLTALTWLVPHETAAVSVQVLCTPYNHAPYHFMQSHIRHVQTCLAVTCNQRFWQNDRDLLHATAVTRGWNGYRNKSQHWKLTLQKYFYPAALAETRTPGPFSHESDALTTKLSPAQAQPC